MEWQVHFIEPPEGKININLHFLWYMHYIFLVMATDFWSNLAGVTKSKATNVKKLFSKHESSSNQAEKFKPNPYGGFLLFLQRHYYLLSKFT